MDRLLDITVNGVPAPQGSKRHVGNGIMVESSAKVKPWREAVKYGALDARNGYQQPAHGPLTVEVSFYLPRPKGHHRTGKYAGKLRDSAPDRPATRPDVDKLVRSTLDALKDAGVYRDDSQIVNLGARKWYADSQPTGAHIIVRSIDQ